MSFKSAKRNLLNEGITVLFIELHDSDYKPDSANTISRKGKENVQKYCG